MLRTIIWLLVAVIVVILLLPVILVLKIVSLFKPGGELPKAMDAMIHIVVPFMVKLAGVRFEVTGKENLPAEGTASGNSDSDANSTAAVYAGNHQGYFDAVVPLLHIGKSKSVVLKKEISKIPFAGWCLRFFGCIFLDRSSLKAQVSCINEMEARLRSGRDIAIFPEGTRSQGPDMAEFKAGAFRAAIAAGVPVVPFMIDGSWLRFEAKHRLTPGVIRLSILPPVSTDGLTTKDAKELAVTIHDQIQQEQSRLRAEKGTPNA